MIWYPPRWECSELCDFAEDGPCILGVAGKYLGDPDGSRFEDLEDPLLRLLRESDERPELYDLVEDGSFRLGEAGKYLGDPDGSRCEDPEDPDLLLGLLRERPWL